MDELLDILKELKPDVDFEKEEGLIDNAILDSFDIVELINRLKEAFDIDITPAEIIPENFNSAKSLQAMIEKLQ